VKKSKRQSVIVTFGETINEAVVRKEANHSAPGRRGPYGNVPQPAEEHDAAASLTPPADASVASQPLTPHHHATQRSATQGNTVAVVHKKSRKRLLETS
jgi:hypothetical protein